ncbi:MAG: hypothetical protein AAFZ15_21640 [Bacteroidota bacterium]
MKNALFIFFFLFIGSNLLAQTAVEKYEQNSIYISGNKYIKNGVKYPLGLFYGKLEKEMDVSPAAQLEWKTYQKNKNTFWPLYIAGISSFLAGALIYHENENAGIALSATGAASLLVSFPFAINMQKSASKAVWVRNRDILK